jgi:hypothetical protein
MTPSLFQEDRSMTKRNIVWTACAASLFVLALGAHVRAGNLERTTYLTFSRAVRLPGVSLEAGTYIFEVANPTTSANVVRVMSRDRRTAYFQGFTIRVPKPPRMNRDAVVSLGEAGPGMAPAVTAWWPIGEDSGHEFIYRGN